ncbi:hypothetical protein [Streptomyces sp. NPDC093598]|uniref:hypothetical protein n=1 Tax=Streptomyces sp. NPDC093598 TaxID=3366046 RepID=UPI003803AE53
MVGRPTHTPTSATTHTEGNGHTHMSTTKSSHYEATWQRADGSWQVPDVLSSFCSGEQPDCRPHCG